MTTVNDSNEILDLLKKFMETIDSFTQKMLFAAQASSTIRIWLFIRIYGKQTYQNIECYITYSL